MARKPTVEQIRDMADRAEHKKHPGGRPPKYDTRYCDEVIEFSREGLSLTAFAGSIGVCRATIGNWMVERPEFLAATKKAAAVRTLALERGLLTAENGPTVTARIFALKNAAPQEWREKTQVEHSGLDGGPIQTESKLDLSALDREDRSALRDILERATKKED